MSLQPGIYKHFKGGRYSVLLTALDSETTQEVVVYVSLDTGSIWCRPVSMWHEMVRWPDGVSRPRFVAEVPMRGSITSNLKDPGSST